MGTTGSNLSIAKKLTPKLIFRHWLRNWQKLVAICLVVAIGTSVYIAIGIANKATVQSFESFTATLSGKSDLTITSSFGGITPADLIRARNILMETEATLAPVLESNIQLVSENENNGNLLAIGIDSYPLINHLSRLDQKSGKSITNFSELGEALSYPNPFFSDTKLAMKNGWDFGDKVSFIADSKIIQLDYAGPFPSQSQDSLSEKALVVDAKKFSIALGRPLRFDRLELILSATDTKPTIERKLEEGMPSNWVIETQDERKRTGESMTHALRMNLKALSSLSLLVAAFLVFQALDSSVAKRYKEIATLHSLGSPRWLTKLLWISESILIGMIGGCLGIFFGNLLGKISTGMVAQTVNTLYYFSDGQGAQLSFSNMVSAWCFVVFTCTLAGWWPANQASKVPPAQLINHQSNHSGYKAKHYYLLIILFSIGSFVGYLMPPLAANSGHSIPVGGYFLAVNLVGLIVSVGILNLGRLGELTPVFSKYDHAAKIGISYLRTPVMRHRLALGGVTIAVGMTAAMIILISSFEGTVRNWIGSVLQADLFIRSKAAGALYSDAKMQPSIVQEIFSDTRIVESSIIQTIPIRVDGFYTKLISYDFAYTNKYKTLSWIKTPPSDESLLQPLNAVISESFQERFKKNVGDSVRLPFRDQSISFEIIGIYADYGNEQGSIGTSSERYRELTADDRATGLALHIQADVDLLNFAEELRTKYPSLSVVTNKWLREETMRIFNRVFSVTYALEIVGLFISVAGLGSMIFSLMLERIKNLSALRMIGLSRASIRRASVWEAGSIAFLGSLYGLVLGFVLGLVLIYIINKQSFGWTLEFNLPFIQLSILATGVIFSGGFVADKVSKWILKQPLEREE